MNYITKTKVIEHIKHKLFPINLSQHLLRPLVLQMTVSPTYQQSATYQESNKNCKMYISKKTKILLHKITSITLI